MPKFAALIKVTNCRQLGANVVLHGADLSEARTHAEELARRDGLTFVHPFDDANVMAGQGTMALEILDQAPDADAIVVPVGGGGLLSGIGTVVKALRPQMTIVAVEPEHAACLVAALAAGHPVPVPVLPTLADGLAVSTIGARPFEVLRRVVDRVVTVDEASIALAILRLIELEKSVVEGAGATPLAAFLSGKLDDLRGRKVVLTLCGGNIDLTMLDRVLETGLVADGRLTRFAVSIADRPGGLARLAEIIASTGASIKEIVHDRAFSGPDPGVVVDLHDPGVGQPGHGTGLAGEADPALGGLGQVGVEQLHRHLAVEGAVPAAVDHGHASAPDLLEQLVAPQRPDHVRLPTQDPPAFKPARRGAPRQPWRAARAGL
jgi:threonine dehydratase